jgi:putative transposase
MLPNIVANAVGVTSPPATIRPARLRLRNADRLIFVWLYRLFPSLLGATVIFKPETLVRWHRGGFRLYWRRKSRRRRVGRPAVPVEIRRSGPDNEPR